MAAGEIEIDGANRIVRAHQLEFLRPPHVTKVKRAELSERDDAADRLRVIRIVEASGPRHRREASAVRIWFAASGKRRILQDLPGGGDDPPVEPGDRNSIAGLDDQVLRFAIEVRVGRLKPLD